MRALLIINPISGDAEPNTAKVERIRAALAGAPFDPEVAFTEPEKTAAEIARQAVSDGVEIILVGGGDGTVSEVARELVNKEATLGIVPIGTFNNMARSLAIPPEIEAACGIIAGQHFEKIDVGFASSGEAFFEAAGAGLDAELFPLGEEIKGGQWTRMFQALRLTFQYRAPKFRLTLDCTVAEALKPEMRRKYRPRELRSRVLFRRALFVVAANGPYYGTGFTVAPSAGMQDGKLTVSFYRNFSKWQLMRHFLSIAQGKRHYSPKIETFSAREVEIFTPRPVPVHLDGHPFGETPIQLRAEPGALRVFVPEKKDQSAAKSKKTDATP